MTRVALALGSNLGDRLGNLRKALRMLKLNGIEIVKSSDIFETKPVGPQDQGRFLNACIIINSNLSPHSLLALLKEIEHKIGRKKREKWGPREIDLDILLYGDKIISEKDLIIPHPEFPERAFVLLPLEQIASGWVHPINGKSIRELKDQLKDMDQTMLRISHL